MTRCKLCNHPQRDEIERKLVAREMTQVEAAAQVKCNPSAISRHLKNCFPRKVAEWVKPEATKQETINVINELVRSHRDLLGLYEEARSVGNLEAGIRALGEERRHLELVARLTGQIDERPSVSILLSPEYLELKAIINTTLAPYPELRQKLGDAFAMIASGSRSGDGDANSDAIGGDD